MWLLKKNNILSLLGVLVILFLFVLIRHFQSDLFYDPLIVFYKSNFQNAMLPEIDLGYFVLHTIFRFLINTFLSFLVIYIAFKEMKFIKVSFIIYGVVFLITITALVVVINIYEPRFAMLLFYIRRFLIQPFLLLLVLPAFYYHKKLTKLKV